MQNRTADPAALAPMARLMSVGDVLVQNDLAIRALRPAPAPAVLAVVAPAARRALPPGRLRDAQAQRVTHRDGRRVHVGGLAQPALALPPRGPGGRRPPTRSSAPSPPPVRCSSPGTPSGWPTRRASGLLDTTSPVIYAGTLDSHPAALASALAGGATLVVTDSNRKQSFLWNTVSNNAGITLAASDPQAQRGARHLPRGPRRRPVHRPDRRRGLGDLGPRRPGPLRRPWRSTASAARRGRPTSGASPLGKFWQVTLAKQATTGRIRILQPAAGDYEVNQWITQATTDLRRRRARHRQAGLGVTFRCRAGGDLPAADLHHVADHGGRHQPDRGPRTRRPEAASPVGLAEVGRGRGARPAGHRHARRPSVVGGTGLPFAPARSRDDPPARGPGGPRRRPRARARPKLHGCPPRARSA